MQKAVAYYRVSTERQGRSGLGLEAQQRSVEDFARRNEFELVYEYVEIESGKRNLRHGLNAALSECRKEHATLLIAKLDRLSRSVAFISTLMESGVEFKVVDNPYAEKFTLHILAAVAQKEREDISKRTTDALAAAKLRGVELGTYGRKVLSARNKILADEFARKMQPIIAAIKGRGITTIRAIATELNKLNIPTYYKASHKWHLNTVHKLIARFNNEN